MLCECRDASFRYLGHECHQSIGITSLYPLRRKKRRNGYSFLQFCIHAQKPCPEIVHPALLRHFPSRYTRLKRPKYHTPRRRFFTFGYMHKSQRRKLCVLQRDVIIYIISQKKRFVNAFCTHCRRKDARCCRKVYDFMKKARLALLFPAGYGMI